VPRRIVDVDAPDRFVAAPDVDADDEGDCYLEVVRRRRRMSVSLGLEQLSRLADGVLVIVDELERRGLVAIEIGSVEPPAGRSAPRHAFRAETLAIEWDDDGHRIVIEARSAETDAGVGVSAPPPGVRAEDAVDEVPDDAPLGPDVLRVRLSPHMAQRFARQAAQVVGKTRRGRGPAGEHRPGAG
jgi:uncharacterized repeat protein (TIGR03847 family)